MSRANQTSKVEMDSYQILIIEEDLAVSESLWAELLREGFNVLPIQPVLWVRTRAEAIRLAALLLYADSVYVWTDTSCL